MSVPPQKWLVPQNNLRLRRFTMYCRDATAFGWEKGRVTCLSLLQPGVHSRATADRVALRVLDLHAIPDGTSCILAQKFPAHLRASEGNNSEPRGPSARALRWRFIGIEAAAPAGRSRRKSRLACRSERRRLPLQGAPQSARHSASCSAEMGQRRQGGCRKGRVETHAVPGLGCQGCGMAAMAQGDERGCHRGAAMQGWLHELTRAGV